MPSKRQYDLVQNDEYDTRIPLHPEEAFHHGITFQAKYIGMLDVPRPSSRVEIVAAMRRIRYEFKTKGIKKKKVTIEVSVDGVRVTLRKKKKRKHWMDDGKSILLNHPVYRIFYVSHDSQDLKIFSYIARDGASNVFKCAVFKSNKKSQAMRVVRTIGQAFEVCHNLSITAPENNVDHEDDQDTFTQDLLSDRLSDITSDKPKKDYSESASDKGSLPTDDCSLKDLENNRNSRIPPQLDLIPPPPTTNNRKSPLTSGETYSSPHSDTLLSAANGAGGGNSGGGSCNALPPPGSALSAHHELQLMREQLEQQTQQTQAAMAQLQLAREQLQAEQAARLEAQARTHQLLVHNRELLDHIAALVAHLQGGDKQGQQQTPPHMTMPQNQHQMPMSDGYDTSEPSSSLDSSPVLPPFSYIPHSLIENRAAVASCLQPSSPLRTTFNPAAFPFGYAPGEGASFEAQLLQRLQTLGSYPAYHQGYYAPYVPPMYGSQTLLNNSYTLQPPPQKKMAPQSPMMPRNSYAGSTAVQGTRLSPARNSEPRQLPTQYQNLNLRVNDHQTYQTQSNTCQSHNSACQNQQYQAQNANSTRSNDQQFQRQQYQQNTNQNQLRVQPNNRQQRETTPVPQTPNEKKQTQFIKPQAQMGTLTTTDSDGRMRVIVPVPSNSNDNNEMMSNLRLDDTGHSHSSPVTRSKSEKVPNRSQLMAEVHRTIWARHTTK